MQKVYNLSKLFQENEFDVQKGYRRYGTKEAYFTVLYRFTLDSEKILRECKPYQYLGRNDEIGALTRNVERLQGMLANIGAINLAWNIQSLNHLIDRRYYKEYIRRLNKIFIDVDKLRKRIVDAEKKPEPDTKRIQKQSKIHKKSEKENAPVEIKRRVKPRRGDFNKLMMLVDNFELKSAMETVTVITRYSYTPEIDKGLEEVREHLANFNYDKALEGARKLFGLAICAEEADNPLKKSILAIDDMPDVLKTVKSMLKDRYKVFCATDYDSAIKFLRSNTADLILLDIEMPGLDGFAIMQMLRKLPDYEKTPIVFLTSKVSDEHISMAKKLGASDFIRKPVDLAVLNDKLERAICSEQDNS